MTLKKASLNKATVSVLSNQLGKLPPQATEVEEVVLGAIMLERESIYDIASILQPKDFYKEANQMVMEAIYSLFEKNEPIDIKTVTHELRKQGKLKHAGGAYYVSQLTAKVNSASNIETHARIIAEQSMKRELIQLSMGVQHDAYEDSKDVFKLMDSTFTSLENIQEGIGTNNIQALSSNAMGVIERAESAKKARENNEIVGIPTGILELDKILTGLRPGDLMYLAGRPSMGKTALATTILNHVGVELGIPCGMLSLEMSNEQVSDRLTATATEIPLDAFRNGSYTSMDEIVHKMKVLETAKVYLDDEGSLSPLQIKTKARMMVRKNGIKVLILDYIQLCEIPGLKANEQTAAMSKISQSLKGMAKDLGIPVIALSQLSRAVEQRGGDKRPIMSDLRDSGSLEQDADVVGFVYRPEYYGIDFVEFDGVDHPSAGLGEIIIAKNRNGATGSAWARYIGKITKWKNRESEWKQEAPQQFPTDKTDFNISLPKNGKDETPF